MFNSGRIFNEASSAIRTRTTKEAMETNVLLLKEQYLQMDDVSIPNEPELQDAAFKAYVETHRRLALERFFFCHKDEAWFVERYLGDEFEQEKSQVQERFAKFLEDYSGGKFQDLSLDATMLNETFSRSENSDIINVPLAVKLPEPLDAVLIDRFSDVLAIGSIPPNIKKASIESVPIYCSHMQIFSYEYM